MNWNNTLERYGSFTIGLHWLMFMLIAGVYACIELKGFFPKGSDARDTLKTWHFMLGLGVFVLIWLRLAIHLLQVKPKIKPEPPIWQDWMAKSFHVALYVLMIGMPLTGWLILSAAGKPIPFFGLSLPALLAENKPTAKFIKEIHETAGNIGYGLIGLHAAAALFHHYYQKDDTLIRMLPGRK